MNNTFLPVGAGKFALILTVVAWCAAWTEPGLRAQEEGAADGKVGFVPQIQQIFEQHCISCHGPTKSESFRIDDPEDVMGYIEPGDSDASQLYESLISDDEEVLMPPPGENNPLSRAQIRLVRDWIRQGAVWPEGVTLKEPGEPAVAGGETAGGGASSTDSPPSASAGEAGESGMATGQPAQDAAGGNAAAAGQSPEGGGAGDDIPEPVRKPLGERIWLALGSLHPAAVHLPIGLLLGAGLFSLFGLRGSFMMGDCAYYCLWLGAIGCLLASVLGWPSAIAGGYGGDPKDLFDTDRKIFLHRISGIGTTVFALLLALYASAKRASDPDDGLLWKLGAIVLAIAIGWVGHLGGKVTHGDRHYDSLLSVTEEVTGWELDGKPNPGAFPAAVPDGGGMPPAGDDEKPTGETSEEQAAPPAGEGGAGPEGGGNGGT